MILTNRLNLPQPIVDAVRNDPYSRGDSDVSVTSLIDSARKATLLERHRDEIVEDAADRIWSLMGQSIHTILERANKTGIAERRLIIERDGWKVSGGMDRYENGTIQDYKTTSVWKLLVGTTSEWEKQLNLYAVLLRDHGHEVTRAEVVALLRDWQKNRAADDIAYPQAQVVNVPITLWENAKAEEYLSARIAAHKSARNVLPECTPEERWAKSSSYAVMKKGGKRAARVYETEGEAIAHVGFDKELFVQTRVGDQFNRCREYCPVSKFCSQYQASLANAEGPTASATIKTANE